MVPPIAAMLASCGFVPNGEADAGERDAMESTSSTTVRVVKAERSSGTVIDQADVLTEEEATQLSQRAAELSGERRSLMVVVLRQLPRTSMEQVGWAVNRQGKMSNRVLLLVDPEQRRIRVEGAGVTPAQGAKVAGTMLPFLEAGKVAQAIDVGLSATAAMLDQGASG